MLRVDGISVAYDRLVVLRDVSLEANEGESIGIFGPNGHGKTTLLKTISGLLKPLKGAVFYRDRAITGLTPEEIVNLGIAHVPQGSKIFPDLTVGDNLLMGAFNSAAWRARRENVESVYGVFPHLKELAKRKGVHLSGGERQMLAVGRGLMANPKVLMLDEPSLGLSPKVCLDLIDRIKHIRTAFHSTIVLVEQNVLCLSELADRLYLIENGQVVLQGERDRVLSDERVHEVYLGVT